jgi:hypothetical protein
MKTKLQQLLDFMEAGDWQKALAMAARFPDLGAHRDAILLGHEARVHERMYRQLGKDPEECFRAGCEALRERYAEAIKRRSEERSTSVSSTK